MKEMIFYRVFTDGSSTVYHDNKNLRYGGIGVYFENNEEASFFESYSGEEISNQLMELTACLKGIEKGIELAKKNKLPKNQWQLQIVTDSMYTINCISVWAENWIKNNWCKKDGKDICHLNIIKKIYSYYITHKISFVHVNSHIKDPTMMNIKFFDQKDLSNCNDKLIFWKGNKEADRLAEYGTSKAKSL